MNTTDNRFRRATQETIQDLQRVVAASITDKKLTRLSLPEVEAVVNLVGKVIPAGNVPGMILSGLTSISSRQIQPQKARQDVNILFKEVLYLIEHAKYGAMFMGPAAIIWGYQNLLRLAGKDPESAFPEGIWQFYVDYALREDTARHTNETHGFDTLLAKDNITLDEIDRLTAWVMASVHCLHQYHHILACEWYERAALWQLQELTGNNDLFSQWEQIKPYSRGVDAGNHDYPAYRRLKFDEFLKPIVSGTAPSNIQSLWEDRMREGIEQSLPPYQKQMTIMAYLESGSFGETRVPIALEQAYIGVIHAGNYFLIPICEPGTNKPLDVRTARAQIARLLAASPAAKPAKLADLIRAQRADLFTLRKKLNPTLRQNLDRLRFAPILINTDKPSRSRKLLSEIRRGERGIGDHPLTIFDTGKTFVFDQSHIFFDGNWGAALAEILTNEALSWAGYLNLLSPAVSANTTLFSALDLHLLPADAKLMHGARKVSWEAGAENDRMDIKVCLDLKHIFKQRSDLLKVTINDLLVLYRAIHAVTYSPSQGLEQTLGKLALEHPKLASQVQQELKNFSNQSPAILIPVDAGKNVPRDRIYPMNLEVPLAELDLMNLHRDTLRALLEYVSVGKHDSAKFAHFDSLQRRYLATLGGFGTILAKAKEIAAKGESASIGAIKLLAHLPTPIKQMLDKVPARYEKLNNMLKGTEVLSNLGAMAKSSSVVRFISAKDDNDQKQLVWGVMTDAQGVMRISLRDFRPHVSLLIEAGMQDTANQMAQDFLDAYVKGFNEFIQEVIQIAVARPLDSNKRNVD